MASGNLRRRGPVSSPNKTTAKDVPGLEDYNKAGVKLPSNSISWKSAFLVLLASKLLSAFLNIVHDCDETYNYWEPLHYLIHGYGLQTWEYR
jgi:hypothetical protein